MIAEYVFYIRDSCVCWSRRRLRCNQVSVTGIHPQDGTGGDSPYARPGATKLSVSVFLLTYILVAQVMLQRTYDNNADV